MKVLVKNREYRVTPAQAKVLFNIGRATYITRDMNAQPVVNVEQFDVDAFGVKWDESLHAASRVKNQDGSWRKRPGAKAEAKE
jgi:hypothetical protein